MKHKKKKDEHNQSPPVSVTPDISGGGFGFYPVNEDFTDLSVPAGELEESLKGCMHYPISKKEVDACDVKQLVHDLRPTMKNPLFAAGPGKVIFEVEGYDIKPRHLVLVPEFRSFLQKAEESHPCWFYFAWPYSEWPNLVTLSCLPQIWIRNTSHNRLDFGVDRDQLFDFLRCQANSLERVCTAKKISQDAGLKQLDRLFNQWFPDFWLG